MIAVVIVRDGVLPAGFDEAICEAGRETLLVGSGVARTLDDVASYSCRTWTLDLDPAQTSARSLAAAIAHAAALTKDERGVPTDSACDPIVFPASPDGRDLAPHVAMALGLPLFAGSMRVTPSSVTAVRHGGLQLVDFEPHSSFVATLQLGVRGSDLRADSGNGAHVHIELAPSILDIAETERRNVESIEIQPPDATTMDLAEAPRIIGGGAGLNDAEMFERLHRVAAALNASMGVTRVITDRGWADHTRQIGTTGVVVDPQLYISFGISGAVQHTSGLGRPDHIISVNTDAHCPMMQMSDVAIVADANDVLRHLESRVADIPVAAEA